ncbi:MAG: DegV family protein [Clostridia bacterium]|nr:DegV family protein [Clostridia bacterium]
MRNFIISTERTCDLSTQVLAENQIESIGMKFSINNVEYSDENSLTGKEYCDFMREGAITSTSAVNPYDAKVFFTELLKQGKDILHIGFSSGLSSTFKNMQSVAEELNATHENKIYLVDTLSACSGQGLMCMLAVEKADQGKDIKEVYNYLETIKNNVCAFFTVDHLKYLERGGRISKATAIAGTLLQIKPVLHLNDEGAIVQYKKVTGRKKSIMTLCEEFVKRYTNVSSKIYIAHADSLEDAELLQSLIKRKSGLDSQIFELSRVICSHSGPGTIALFFVGNER